MTINDDILKEVRLIREAYAAQFNYDIKAIFADIKRGESQLQETGVQFISPPEQTPNPSLTQWQRFQHLSQLPPITRSLIGMAEGADEADYERYREQKHL